MAGAPLDWALAERVATRVAQRGAAVHDQPSDADVAPLAVTADALVAAETRLRPPTAPQVHVVDRPAWISANLAGFRQLLEPAFERWTAKAPARSAALIGRVGAVELGVLLGWMSSRVLGQYDVLVAADADGSADRGEVYLVGPNIAALEQRFGFDREQFRLWITIHELTHRAQFSGVPWMRGHYLDLVHTVLDAAEPDPARLAAAVRSVLRNPSGARQALRDGGAVALFAPPPQREAMERVAGLMSLLEGHGDTVMDRAATGLLPEARRFARVLRQRRQQGNPAVKFMQRMLGIEAKLDQYRAGEEFIAALDAAGGPTLVDRCWEGPANLPTLTEIRAPHRWLDRMGLAHAVA